MIVIGVDVHKHSLSAVAVDELGRSRGELSTASGGELLLLALPGCGPLSAAKLLCEIGPIGRFQSDSQLARHASVAPLEASSGKQRRHRLDRGGNRQLNCSLHRIAVTQGRVHAPARAYLERKQSEGKPPRGDPLPRTGNSPAPTTPPSEVSPH